MGMRTLDLSKEIKYYLIVLSTKHFCSPKTAECLLVMDFVLPEEILIFRGVISLREFL